MNHAGFIAWAEAQDKAGERDAMGGRWTDWKLAVYKPDGTALRDKFDRQVFETQAEYKARQHSAPAGQTMDLFA